MIKKAIVTAAGNGTRQFPMTKSVQKEMLPLIDSDGVTKPTIQIILEELLEAGIEQIALIVQPNGAKGFKQHFFERVKDARFAEKPEQQEQENKLGDIAKHITFIEQREQLGFGHAVFCARDWVGREPVLLCLGDHVYVSKESISCTRQLLNVYERQNVSVIGLQQTPEDQLHLYGTVTGELINPEMSLYRLARILEKPAIETARSQLQVPGLDQYLTVFGMYALVPDLFDILAIHIQQNKRSDGEFQLTHALATLMDKHPVFGVEIKGKRLDMGTPAGYLHTLMSLGLSGPFRTEILKLCKSKQTHRGGE